MAQDYEGFMSEDDFDNILEYSDMCDKHGSDAVDDYMEFHDELDNFEEVHLQSDTRHVRKINTYIYALSPPTHYSGKQNISAFF